MIIKNILKYFLSIFILLSVLITPHSSQAGNGGHRGEKDPNERRETHHTKKSKSRVVVNHELLENEDILSLILFHPDLDWNTMKNAALVCKTWCRLIIALNDSNNCTSVLQNTLVHPSAFLLAHKKLASEFPYKLVYSKLNPTSKDEKSELVVKFDNLQNIKKFISLIHNSPYYHNILCTFYPDLDPLDFQTVALAGHITKTTPFIQSYLWEIVNENSFKINQFSDFVQELNNHKFLQKYLMALKLLTLSGDEDASARMKESEVCLTDYFKELILMDEYIQVGTMRNQLLNHPLWCFYGVNLGNESYLTLQLMCLAQGMYGNQLNLKRLESLEKYVLAFAPDLKDTFDAIPKSLSTHTPLKKSKRKKGKS